MKYLNLAFYKFVELSDLPELRARLRALCVEQEARGTLIISHEGINASIAANEPAARELLRRLPTLHPGLSDFDVKESWSVSQPFGRMLVKIKKEIIPIGRPDVVPSRETGKRISPEELKRWLDEKRDVVLLDTRNQFEISHGTFEGAISMELSRFRDFPERLQALSESSPGFSEKPVVMFCTGGIRCEKATAVAMKEGFTEVYQLDGGILRYFELCGGAHYKGDCFVFDERVALNPGLQNRSEY